MNNITKTNLKSIELKDKTDLINVKDTNKVLLSLIALTGILGISIFGNLILSFNNYKLAKEEKIFVEQLDGTTEVAVEKDYDFRSEEVIRETVSDWLYLTWEWDSSIPNSEKLDSGMKVKYEKESLQVPSKAYAASYLLEEGFRQEFLKGLSELIPTSLYSGNLTSILTIYHIGKPIRDKNQYKVKVIATRKDITSNGEEREAQFNKIISLKSIEPYRLVLEEDEPNAFRKNQKEILKNGLIITSITNFD